VQFDPRTDMTQPVFDYQAEGSVSAPLHSSAALTICLLWQGLFCHEYYKNNGLLLGFSSGKIEQIDVRKRHRCAVFVCHISAILLTGLLCQAELR
jgi:hypothetical protein